MPRDPDLPDDLAPAESARVRRRDHDATARERDLMRPGMGKVFKQIQDSWAKDASPDQNRAQERAGRGSSRPR